MYDGSGLNPACHPPPSPTPRFLRELQAWRKMAEEKIRWYFLFLVGTVSNTPDEARSTWQETRRVWVARASWPLTHGSCTTGTHGPFERRKLCWQHPLPYVSNSAGRTFYMAHIANSTPTLTSRTCWADTRHTSRITAPVLLRLSNSILFPQGLIRGLFSGQPLKHKIVAKAFMNQGNQEQEHSS